MSISARNLTSLLLLVAGGVLQHLVGAAVLAANALNESQPAEVSQETAVPDAIPDPKAESNPKNIVHFLPPPIADKATSASNGDRQKPAQSSRPRSHYALANSHETATFSDAAPRVTTAQERVHQQAAQRDRERKRRIEGRRWMGYEPARPTISTTPFMSGTPWQPIVQAVPHLAPDDHRHP